MPKQKIIDLYRGKLTAKDIASGMNAASHNARRLFEDAKLLCNARRYPSACALAILSIEEAGKLSQLRTIAVSADERELKDAWKAYRDHQSKNAAWIITELFAEGARTLDDLRPIFDEDSDHPAVLDTLKQLGFYTDCYGKAHWSEPDKVIDEEVTRCIMASAEVLIPDAPVTVREIELWIKNLIGVWGTEKMRSGLAAFFQAMQDEGLAKHQPEKIEAFLGALPRARHH